MTEKQSPFRIIIPSDTARPMDLPFGAIEMPESLAVDLRPQHLPEAIGKEGFKSGGMDFKWIDPEIPSWCCVLRPQIPDESLSIMEGLVQNCPNRLRQRIGFSLQPDPANPSPLLTNQPPIREFVSRNLPRVTVVKNGDDNMIVYSANYEMTLRDGPDSRDHERIKRNNHVIKPEDLFSPAVANLFKGYEMGTILEHSGKTIQTIVEKLHDMFAGGVADEQSVRNLVNLYFAVFPK